MAAYAPVCGQFARFTDFFDDADSPLMRTRLQPDEYRAPYLAQNVARSRPDPISRYVRYYARRTAADAAQTLATLSSLVRNRPLSTIADLPDEVERRAMDPDVDAGDFDKQLVAGVREATAELAGALPRDAASAARGYLVFNPLSWSRQVEVETPELTALPTVNDDVVGVHDGADSKRALVEVPPLGFAWVGVDAAPAPSKAKPARKRSRPIAEGNHLRNEWFEVAIHPTTGGIQAIHDVGRRGNRLSQQLAMRMPDEWNEPDSPASVEMWHDVEDGAIYSAMAADTIEITSRVNESSRR
jgi:alpha-mannosidase